MKTVRVQPMDRRAFLPYGDLIDFDRAPSYPINDGMCDRYHAVATCEALGADARIIISLGRARPYSPPLTITMLERHPLGSQAFVPLTAVSFLVVVAADHSGRPEAPKAFLTQPGQGVNYHRNTWHAVLTPIGEPADFLIVDRDGSGTNLEEHVLKQPFICELPAT